MPELEPIHLIMTHENADLDAVASLLAATRLYPQAKALLPRNINRNVRHFLTLYGADLPLARPEDLPHSRIDRVTLVDTQSLVTIKGMVESPQVHIIDHHLLSRELKPGWSFSGQAVGATTTLLVEQLIRQQDTLSPIEATLMLLGIYEDTGSLAYLTTTARDVYGAAWLLEHGASLEIANDFLHYPLTPDQRNVYERLLEQAESIHLVGHTVILAAVAFPDYVEEVSVLAHKLYNLFEPDGLFLLIRFDDQIQLVARSTHDAIDVSLIAAALGGGGHSKAAAALIRGMSLPQARERLLRLLEQHVRPAITVRQIMSFGVRTVLPTTTVAQAAELMQRYGHEGFPVIDKGQVIGMLSRREIDRAMRLGLEHATIAMYMTKGQIVVRPDDEVETVQQIMIEFNVGQVPVIDADHHILGIVTRTDLIRHLFGGDKAAQHAASPRREHIARLLGQAVDEPQLALLWQAAECAGSMGFKLYIVGGFVRDLLLGRPNFDIDLVVEGDAIALARQLAGQGGGRVRAHERFGTAKWIREDGEALDFVTARTEFYAHPTALPQVERSSIKQDLYRRDFTINTLAIRLDADHKVDMLDFYGGEQDLRDGVIRVLHSLSFIEDPTRILRAVRLERRLGFRIEPRTQELIANALPLLGRVSGERIRHELYLLFQEPEPESGLSRMEELGILRQIHPGLRCNGWLQQKFRTLRQVMHQWYEASWKPSVEEEEHDGLHGMPMPTDNAAQIYLALLTCRLLQGELDTLIAHIRVGREDAGLLQQVARLRDEVEALQVRDVQPGEVYDLLEPFAGPAILTTWIAADSPRVREYLTRYWQTYRHIQPILTGQDLKTMGFKPGPIFGRILTELRRARLNGQVETVEQEKEWVRAQFAPDSTR